MSPSEWEQELFSGDKKDKSGGGIGGKMTPSAVLALKMDRRNL